MTKGSNNKEPLDIFPAEMAALRSQTQLSMAKEQLELERGQIYKKLSSIKDKGKLTSVYDSLGFSSGERKKKNRFANFIWDKSDDDDADTDEGGDVFDENTGYSVQSHRTSQQQNKLFFT
eukprot:8753363-Ditylum_brightwellii.AAC.1